jgi:hypothetical protein
MTPEEADIIRQGIETERSFQYANARAMLGDFEATFTRDADGVWHTEVATSTEV